MGKSFWGLVLAFVFCVQSIAATPRFLKREHCVEWLTLETPLDVTRTVDLGTYRANLLKLGYPNSVVDTKIEEIAEAPQDIKTYLSQHPDGVSIKEIKELAIDRVAHDILKQLGYWNEVPGFSSHEFIWHYLSNFSSSVGVEETNLLIGWSHLWLDGPHSFNNAKLLLKSSIDPFMPGWLLREYRGPKKENLENAIAHRLEQLYDQSRDVHQFLLEALSYVPAKSIPNKIKTELSYWLDNKTYPAVLSDSLETCHLGDETAGNCQNMTNGHLGSLGLVEKKQENWRKNVLIRVNGLLVGSLKLVGNQSMIALRNVVRSDGQQVLVMGGVYTLPKDLVAEILSLEEKDMWQGVNLPNLKVVPHSILINDNAWSNLNDLGLLDMAKEDLSKEEALAVALAFRESDSTKLRDLLEYKTWKELLKRLDKVRHALERK